MGLATTVGEGEVLGVATEVVGIVRTRRSESKFSWNGSVLELLILLVSCYGLVFCNNTQT